MKDEFILKALREEARKAGICQEGMRTLAGCVTFGQAVDFFTANPDWCLERGFPTKGLLDILWSNHETRHEMEKRGVYMNYNFNGEVLNLHQAYIFIGCQGWIRTGLNVEKSIIPMLYFASGSDMRVMGDGRHWDTAEPIVPIYRTFDSEAEGAARKGEIRFTYHDIEPVTDWIERSWKR